MPDRCPSTAASWSSRRRASLPPHTGQSSACGSARLRASTHGLVQGSPHFQTDMMKQTGLQPNQIRRLSQSIERTTNIENGRLPMACPPSHHRPVRSVQSGSDNPFGPPPPVTHPTMLSPDRRSSLRPKQVIQELSPYETERRPMRPTKDRSVEKEKFANWMASNGMSTEPLVDDHVGAKRALQLRRARDAQDAEPLDEFQMVMQEIEERAQWLQEMSELGQGEKYRRQVDTEIKLRIRRLEQLEKERKQMQESA